jgi:antitoxin CcdA
MPRTAKLRSTTSRPARATKPTSERARVNLSLRSGNVEEARELGLNLSRIADEGIAAAVRAERARRWTEENREAIEHHRRRIERDGPLNADLISF